MAIHTEEVIIEDRATETVAATGRAVEKEVSAIKANQVIWLIAGIINTLLLLRILFILFDARQVGFTSFLYSLTNPLTAPFRGIFPAPSDGNVYLDVAAVVAIVIYSLIAWGISALIDTSRPARVQA